MSLEYFTNYEKLCLSCSIQEIQVIYPLVPRGQIEEDIKQMRKINTEWEKAKFERFLHKIKNLIYGY